MSEKDNIADEIDRKVSDIQYEVGGTNIQEMLRVYLEKVATATYEILESGGEIGDVSGFCDKLADNIEEGEHKTKIFAGVDINDSPKHVITKLLENVAKLVVLSDDAKNFKEKAMRICNGDNDKTLYEETMKLASDLGLDNDES